jgi:hypothetical protein
LTRRATETILAAALGDRTGANPSKGLAVENDFENAKSSSTIRKIRPIRSPTAQAVGDAGRLTLKRGASFPAVTLGA